ncbi:hypothetical protein [Soonwooa sp.]|uniref:hypothetical protein n=1 Tax=Soonwooa sp. TaxID=1938592 RepID=UPI0026161C1B|nr:hypothetical protein [Soonwooa sp.]
MEKRIFLKLFLVGCTLALQKVEAQQNIMFSNDLYSGVSSSSLSPTQTYINPNPWDIQIFSEDVNVYNDYGYVSKQSLLGLTKGKIIAAEPKKGITGANQANVFDYYNKDLANLYFSSDIMGPSFSFKSKIGDTDFNVGLFTRLRTQTTITDLDNYFRFQDQDVSRPIEYAVSPFKTSFMNWGELGLNFATQVFRQSDYKWVLGINLKYEMGFDAFNLQNNKELHLSTEVNAEGNDQTTATSYDLAGSYATNYNFDKKKYDFKQQGSGVGLDFGLSFINQYPDSEHYDFKFDFNILDVGYVKFNGENHSFVGDTKVLLDDNPTFDDTKFESVKQYLGLLSSEVYGDPNKSHISDGFKIGLPTSIHLALSKNIVDNQYLSFNWIQRMPIFENSLKRINALSATYSIQKRTIAYGFSSALYDYRNLQFGAYLRLGPLILGSENMFPFLFKHEKLHAANFFIGLKLYPFWDSEFKRHRREKCNCD